MGAGALALATAALLGSLQQAGEARDDAAQNNPARTAEPLPAFVWRPIGTEHALRPDWAEAFGGVNVERDGDGTAVRAQGLDFYVGHGPGRNDLHIERDSGNYPERWALWFEERDSSVLERDPCLSDPATYKRAAEQLERTLRGRNGQHGFGISLGDEVSLTPWGDPVDLCRSPHCEATFTKRAGATLPFPDTDAVRRALIKGATAPIGPWLARRRFHDEVLVEFVRALAAHSRALAPDVPLGLLGMTGATAFGGLAIEQIVDELDFLEVYATRDARERMLTLRTDQAALRTIIVEDTVPESAAWKTWEHWVRGGDGWVLYDEASLARAPEHVAAIAKAVADVRAADAQLRERKLAKRPRPRGAAIVGSLDSRRVSWLRDAAREGPTWPNRFAGYQAEHGTRELAETKWLRLLEDSGFFAGALPLERVGAHTAGRFGLLVLPHVLVADDRDLAQLHDYLKAGGRLIFAGDFAWIDSRGRRRAADPRKGWSEEFPGQILPAPRAHSRYRRERLTHGAGTRAEVRGWFERDGASVESLVVDGPALPVRLESRGTAPWLVCSAYDSASATWIVRAIPNLDLEEDRRAALSGGTTGHLSVSDGHAVEWIHPQGGPGPVEAPGANPDPGDVHLPLGEALVFLVR